MKKDFTVVTDTPVYVQNVISALNLSEVSVSLTFQPNAVTSPALEMGLLMCF